MTLYLALILHESNKSNAPPAMLVTQHFVGQVQQLGTVRLSFPTRPAESSSTAPFVWTPLRPVDGTCPRGLIGDHRG